jgi:predicted type IV restriction endonuclease
VANWIEVRYERFQELMPEFEAILAQTPNESDTRLKVLDRLLFDVLDWKHEAIYTEPPTEAGYIDYLLTTGEHRGVVVIEAKRAGLLAPATKNDELMHVSLSGPVVKPLISGIKQAMSYALENGVAVGVVTDGCTWLFFRASKNRR